MDVVEVHGTDEVALAADPGLGARAGDELEGGPANKLKRTGGGAVADPLGALAHVVVDDGQVVPESDCSPASKAMDVVLKSGYASPSLLKQLNRDLYNKAHEQFSWAVTWAGKPAALQKALKVDDKAAAERIPRPPARVKTLQGA